MHGPKPVPNRPTGQNEEAMTRCRTFDQYFETVARESEKRERAAAARSARVKQRRREAAREAWFMEAWTEYRDTHR